MRTAIASHLPTSPTGRFSHHWLRFMLPLLALSLLIGAIGTIGYRYLSAEIRRENDRTLAVIVEQKRQQIEAWLAEARINTDLAFTATHSLRYFSANGKAAAERMGQI